jgi:hypothetical protein
MSKTRAQIKGDIQTNLTDLNINFYSDTDLNNSVQDAYDDIVSLTQCIQKQVTLPWKSKLSYYNHKKLLVSDYLGTIAIFNNVTNQWLRDDLSLKDFDRIRRDWETWIGTPLFWAPSDPDNIAVCPKYVGADPIPVPPIIVPGVFDDDSYFNSFVIEQAIPQPPILPDIGTYTLYYWATAPVLTSDSDTFLIADDKETLLSQYSTADLLEQAQEFNKAGSFWQPYTQDIEDYADRVKRNCKADLLLRV